jgi:hypothetical protein
MRMLITVCVAAIGFPMAAFAEDGVWVPEDSFAQINAFCTRVYRCTPPQDILHGSDTKVVSTAPKLLTGVCSAGGGPADSCNECLTNPPTDKCEWHLAPN